MVIHQAAAGRLPDRVPDTGSPELDAVLTPALATDPTRRPRPEDLAAALRSGHPTRLLSPQPEPTSTSPRLSPQGRWWVAAGVGLLVLAATAPLLTQAFQQDDSPTTPPPITTSPHTIDPDPTTGTVSTPDTTPPTTQPPDDFEASYLAFEEALRAVHPSELQPNDARDIMKKVDEAVDKWHSDKDREAAEKLEEARRQLDERLDADERSSVLAALENLAAAMGFDLDI
jgi:hypothetical protein